MRALEQVRAWPVENVAAAVVTEAGPVTVGDIDRVFPLASVTKLLVAYAVLIAVEEGAVELDTPAGPEGSTVRHLLAHTSGLAMNSDEILAAPGTRRIYSSRGFEVLADVVAEQTGMDFEQYLAEAVFAPLQMWSTRLVGSAGAGAQSSVRELIRFAYELLAPSLVAPQTLESARTVQFSGLSGVLPGYGVQRPNDWGLGFEIRGDKTPHWTGKRNSPQTFGHFGQSGTLLWVDPVDSDVRSMRGALSCIVLTDRDFGDWAKPLWTRLGDSVVEEAGNSRQQV